MTARARTTAVVVGALVIMTAAGCAAGGPGSGPSAAPDSPVSSGPLTAPPSTNGTPSEPANRLDPDPDAEQLHPERWNRVVPVEGSSTVWVEGSLTGGPPCAVIGRVEVVETASTVTITVQVGQQPDARCDGPVPEIAFPYVTVVALDAPLGDREVVDGAR